MANLRTLALGVFLLMTFSACRQSYTFDAAGMQQISTELDEKFGTDAWYTAIILGLDGQHSKLIVEQTNDPASLTQRQWIKLGEDWQKSAEITIRLDGGKPQDYMFQLGNEVDLALLGNLIADARHRIEEKGVSDAKVRLASVNSSTKMNRKEEGITYTVALKSPSANKDYSFIYNLDGSLKQFNE